MKFIHELYKKKRSGTLIVVDIQPEYRTFMPFDMPFFVDYILNSGYDTVHYLYNGYDTLGMIQEEELKNWLFNIYDTKDPENTIRKIDNIKFYDKGYAYFRYCIDNKIDEDEIIALVKFMYEQDINDSREMNTKLWKKFIKDNQHIFDKTQKSYFLKQIQQLLEFSHDSIYIPDLMRYLKSEVSHQNITVIGGGIEECLKEVEIALKSLNINYNIDHEWTY